MKRHITENDTRARKCQSHAAKFTKVRDGRKAPIRGLWVRNGRFYARLAIEDGATGQKQVRRVPLMDNVTKEPVQTVAQAKEALDRLKVNRSDNDLPVLTRTPKFRDYVTTYLDFIRAGQGTKKPGTIKKEQYALNGWIDALGETRLDRIRAVHINAYMKQRLDTGTSPRTVNLDVGTLRNVLKRAMREGWLKVLPTQNVERLKSSPTTKRDLFTVADLETLCTAARDRNADGSPVTKNAQEFCDYLRLLAYCGAREQEALRLRWDDVDSQRGQLSIGSDGDTKNRTGRVVDFNPKLKAHLKDMHKRRAPDSQWLFPSPQRGEKDIHAQTFRESLKLVRAHAAKQQPTMATKAFHDLRHHFISYCVMSGLDFMTVAEWVGHRDGGILIGKIYGHLTGSHKKEAAMKLNFGPTVVARAARG